MARRDFYEVLEVQRGASADEIKRAYKKLVTQLHPDKNPGNPAAEERFKEATEAYQVLSDPNRRARYDRFGFDVAHRGDVAVNVTDISDLFEGIFGEIFGRGGRRRRSGGQDVRVTVDVSFEEAAFGCERRVAIERFAACVPCRGSGARAGTHPRPCGACRGSGEVRYRQGVFALRRPCATCAGSGRVIVDPCPTCRGQGRRREKHEVVVVVPAGLENGETQKIAGEGDVGPQGGRAGDVLVEYQVLEHPLFQREGDDVHCTVPISFPAATLGAMVEVPTLDGKVKMRVPAGTQPGHVLRLKGKGIVRRGMRTRGDQLVHIGVEVPQRLTKKQREIFEQLSKELGEEAHPQRKTFLEKLRELFGG